MVPRYCKVQADNYYMSMNMEMTMMVTSIKNGKDATQ